MPSIDEIMAKREQKQAERPAFGGGNQFALRDDKTAGSVAMAVAYSLYSGQEGDPYLEYYLGHAYPEVGKNGGQFTRIVYCPVESGHDENFDCQGCKEGVKTKGRFAMWFWVDRILYNSLVQHSATRQDCDLSANRPCNKAHQWAENFPSEEYSDGNRYFVEQVQAVRYWDTSAWDESCLVDIQKLAHDLGDLRQMKVLIKSVNTGLAKRYKFYPERVGALSPMEPALYDQCLTEIKPVLEVLMDSIKTVATVDAPAQESQADTAPTVIPFKTPDALPPAAPVANTSPVLPPFKAPTTAKREKLF